MSTIATSSKVYVRPADMADIDWLVRQLRDFSTFFETQRPLFGNVDQVRSGLSALINHHILLVAAREDIGPVGFIGGTVTPHPMNPSIRVLCEMFWWVDGKHRNSRAGLLLLNEFTEWGKHNADWITFTLETKSPVNTTALTKRGFKLKEFNFLLEVA